MATGRPRSTKSDEEYRRRLENNLNWRIFADISLGAASGVWRYVELGRIISRDELPKILAGTWPRRKTPISGSLIRWSIPFMFLGGLGVECLLKAIRILQFQAAGQPVAAKNRRGSLALAKELKTHDLMGLARAAGITLTPAEVTLLERLTDFVEWAGRYPVAGRTPQLRHEIDWPGRDETTGRANLLGGLSDAGGHAAGRDLRVRHRVANQQRGVADSVAAGRSPRRRGSAICRWKAA